MNHNIIKRERNLISYRFFSIVIHQSPILNGNLKQRPLHYTRNHKDIPHLPSAESPGHRPLCIRDNSHD